MDRMTARRDGRYSPAVPPIRLGERRDLEIVFDGFEVPEGSTASAACAMAGKRVCDGTDVKVSRRAVTLCIDAATRELSDAIAQHGVSQPLLLELAFYNSDGSAGQRVAWSLPVARGVPGPALRPMAEGVSRAELVALVDALGHRYEQLTAAEKEHASSKHAETLGALDAFKTDVDERLGDAFETIAGKARGIDAALAAAVADLEASDAALDARMVASDAALDARMAASDAALAAAVADLEASDAALSVQIAAADSRAADALRRTFDALGDARAAGQAADSALASRVDAGIAELRAAAVVAERASRAALSTKAEALSARIDDERAAAARSLDCVAQLVGDEAAVRAAAVVAEAEAREAVDRTLATAIGCEARAAASAMAADRTAAAKRIDEAERALAERVSAASFRLDRLLDQVGDARQEAVDGDAALARRAGRALSYVYARIRARAAADNAASLERVSELRKAQTMRVDALERALAVRVAAAEAADKALAAELEVQRCAAAEKDESARLARAADLAAAAEIRTGVRKVAALWRVSFADDALPHDAGQGMRAAGAGEQAALFVQSRLEWCCALSRKG